MERFVYLIPDILKVDDFLSNNILNNVVGFNRNAKGAWSYV